jgi:outer membrane protein OmpA-like peptidoglycan-associated protein
MILSMKKFFIVSILVFCIMFCKAQLPPGQYTSKNKKAIALFEKALEFYNSRNDEKSKEELLKSIEKDPAFIEPHLLLAEIYQEGSRKEDAIMEYKKAIEINPGFNLNNYYNLAQIEISVGKYEDAKVHYESFLKKQFINPDTHDIAELQLKNCNFALEAIKHPVPFEPINLGGGVNSNKAEYFPAITGDDQLLLYTRNNRTEQLPLQEDFYTSIKENGKWQPSVAVGNINTSANEGAPCLSANGTILLFCACQELDGSYGPNRKGYGSCDIFYSQKVGEKWTKPTNLGNIINSKFWESQPSFSSDGRTLYFLSNRPGGYGDADIWMSVLNDDGSWAPPKNLGPNVNTKGKEESVYIHPDNQTLYFASNGHVGMGGTDLFVARKDEKGEWGTLKNLGYPINTYKDENSLLVSASGNLAYFASNRQGGYGDLDLYQFDLYEGAQPGKITYVKGKVYDAKTKKPLAASFELIDLQTAKTVIESESNVGNGEFLLTLPVNKDYALNVSKGGYMFYSDNFSLKGITDVSKPFSMDVPLQPIDTGVTVELKNIFFETAKFDLKEESKAELGKLIAFLNINKTIKIEISGHTDNVGDKKSNQTLSQNRAKSVFDYLVNNSIAKERLVYKGYGDSRPKVSNDTEENRAKNRRTEFKVIAK